MPYIISQSRVFSSRDSSASLSDHDDDAITPVEEHDNPAEEEKHEEATRQTNVAAAPQAVDDPFDDARLWQRMLALQRRYHCYNSARMSAAIQDAQVEAVVPPRACMDLLNDSMATAWLCEGARAEAAALYTLVPDGIRSRAGSYGDIYEGEFPTGIRAAMTASPQNTTPVVKTKSTMATPSSWSWRPGRLQRRRRVSHPDEE
ncbi:hypothetical protein SEPCBS57363_001967 [Sporothrix epigloea]|uniref:Uncharacterized protein n=1 Tax=Sporothrix epigloea TaxID=1892477 RepID=A0ABP0DEW4_9PEZI